MKTQDEINREKEIDQKREREFQKAIRELKERVKRYEEGNYE